MAAPNLLRGLRTASASLCSSTSSSARSLSTSRFAASPSLALPFQHRGLRSLSDLEGPLESRSGAAAAPKSASTSASTSASSSSSTPSKYPGLPAFPTPLPPSTTPPSPSTTSASKKASAEPARQSLIVTLSCPDARGIVHLVTGWLAHRSFDIRDSAQYGDPATKRFFMRVHAEGPEGRSVDVQMLQKEFRRDVGAVMSVEFELVEEKAKPRTMLMVSKIGRECRDSAAREEREEP